MPVWHTIECYSEISKLSSVIENAKLIDCLINEFSQLLCSSALLSFER